MGNEQSIPSSRRQNRLSKPRTNTNTLPVRPNDLARRDSVLQEDGLGNSRYSIISQSAAGSRNLLPTFVDSVILQEERPAPIVVPEKKKRLSLFRSKSSQTKIKTLDIGSGVDIDRLTDAPVRKLGLRIPDRWSRSNSLVDLGENSYAPPMQKHRWSRTNSLVGDEEKNRPEKYTNASMQSRWSRSDTLVEREVEVNYEFTPPIPRAPVLRTPEQRAQVQSRPSPGKARMSLQHVPYAQHQARLSLVPEGHTRQPSNRRSLVADTSQQLESPKFSPASRTNSDTQLYGPIRRRSLLQHGVATRNSWVESDSRKSLPSQVVDLPVDLPRFNYTPAQYTSSPIAPPTSVEPKLVDNFRHPRVATPDSADYGHIGAFKLGSLRITNGAASPDLTLERANTVGGEDDYLSAGHARASSHNIRPTAGQRSQTISVPQDMVKPPWITRSESPLQTVQYAEPKPLPLSIDTAPNPDYAAFKFTESPTRSEDFARDYQELTLSPFSFDRSPISPQLESRSKNMATEDDLFEPEPETPDVSYFPARGSVDSGFVPDEAEKQRQLGKGERELPLKPLAKADSGYSSNVSIRSFKNKPPAVPAKEAPPTPPKGPVSRTSSSTYSVASEAGSAKSDKTIRAKRSLPALPKEDMLQSFGEPPQVPKKKSFQNLKTTKTTKSQAQLLAKAKHHGRSKSIPNILKPTLETRISHSSSGSDASFRSNSSRWRRNSKSKLVVPPQPVFTVQASPSYIEQMNIPPPSAAASRHLERRVDAFPITSIPNSFPVIRRSVSKETLKTIFSVGSAEYREELTMKRLQSALPAVPTPIAEEPPRPEVNRRHTYQNPAPILISRKPVQRQKYVPQVTRAYHEALQQKLRQDFETEITSFESVSSSLGKSPYDAAITSSDAQMRQQRAKSMTAQFEADAAARFAQTKTSPSPARSLHKTASHGSLNNRSHQPKVPVRPSSARPPPAHGNGNHIKRFSQRSNPNLREPQLSPPPVDLPLPQLPQLQRSQRSIPNLRDERCGSMVSLGRVKSPPPVSMKTQGRVVLPQAAPKQKSVPQNLSSSVSKPSIAMFIQTSAPPNRLPPNPPLSPTQIQMYATQPPPTPAPAPITEEAKETQTEQTPWSKQQSYWASRKQDAIKTRKSMELQRPEQARLSFEQLHGIQLRRPESAQQSTGFYRSSEGGWERGTMGYDSTFGSFDGGGERDVYQGEAYYDDTVYHHHDGFKGMERGIGGVHARGTSTSDMFSINGFGQGFVDDDSISNSPPERRKIGPVGKAGGRIDADFGVDFSDVPVLRGGSVGS